VVSRSILFVDWEELVLVTLYIVLDIEIEMKARNDSPLASFMDFTLDVDRTNAAMKPHVVNTQYDS
jgi:hypothetical protein